MMMSDIKAIYIVSLFTYIQVNFWYHLGNIFFKSAIFHSYSIPLSLALHMDFTQRHQAAMDAIRKDFDENEDEVLKVPNFSLMERFLVVGGNDPWLFFNNIMKIAYPANKKKSRNAISNLQDELDLRSQNCEFQEEVDGLFGIMKQ